MFTVTYPGTGNIGSYAIDALARLPFLQCLTVVDPDRYEYRNVLSQAIEPRNVGHLKVNVMARRARAINPALKVVPIAARIEHVPLARLRATVIASGLDTRAARLAVNRVARRLGVPWVDAGVRAEGRLARVEVYGSSPDQPCYECGWSSDDYAVLEQSYPCDPEPTTVPTGAPAYLGQLAASVQVAEIHKLLCGETEHTLRGRQLLIELDAHRHYVSVRKHAADCRFDHQNWHIRPLQRSAGAISLRQALRLGPAADNDTTRLGMEGHGFVRRLVCLECGAGRRVLRVAARLDAATRTCQRCRGVMAPSGFETTDTLTLEDCADADRRVSLFAIGMRAGDVFSVIGSSGTTHFEIGSR